MKYKNHRHIPIASACWANEMQNIADKPVIRSNQDIKTAKTCLPRSHISLKKYCFGGNTNVQVLFLLQCLIIIARYRLQPRCFVKVRLVSEKLYFTRVVHSAVRLVSIGALGNKDRVCTIYKILSSCTIQVQNNSLHCKEHLKDYK